MASPEQETFHFPKTPVSSVRRSARRSWFETPPATKIEMAVDNSDLKGGRKAKRRSIDEIETLALTHFTKPPRIGFGKIILGRSKSRILMVQNPNDYEQDVYIERFPFKKGFNIDQIHFTVGPNEVVSLTLTWMPQESGNCREMILLHVNEVYRLQAFLFGSAEDPKPVKQVRKGMMGSHATGQRLACVIQTPALTSICNNYSPRRSEDIRELRSQLQQIAGQDKDQENIVPVEIDVPNTPPPLESTAIYRNDEGLSQNIIDRRKSGFLSPTLTKMSPIPIMADTNSGQIIDSYFAHPDLSPLLKAKIKPGSCNPQKILSEHKTNLGHSSQNSHAKEIKTDNMSDLDAKPYLSPNSFLNDSLSSRKSIAPAVGLIKLTSHQRLAAEVGAISPNSFLEDLTNSRNPVPHDTNNFPSPSTILNDSIPHSIMVQQLASIRSSLHSVSLSGKNKESAKSDTTSQKPPTVSKLTKKMDKTNQPSKKAVINVFAHAHDRNLVNSKKERFIQRKVKEGAKFNNIADTLVPWRKTFLISKGHAASKLSPPKSSRLSPQKVVHKGKQRQAMLSKGRHHTKEALNCKKDVELVDVDTVLKENISQPAALECKHNDAPQIPQVDTYSKCQTDHEMGMGLEINPAFNVLITENRTPQITETKLHFENENNPNLLRRHRSMWASPAVGVFEPLMVAIKTEGDSTGGCPSMTDSNLGESPSVPRKTKDAGKAESILPSFPISVMASDTRSLQLPGQDCTDADLASEILMSPAKQVCSGSETVVISNGNCDLHTPAFDEAKNNNFSSINERHSAGRRLFPDISGDFNNSLSVKPLWAGGSATVTKDRPTVSPLPSETSNSFSKKLFPGLKIITGLETFETRSDLPLDKSHKMCGNVIVRTDPKLSGSLPSELEHWKFTIHKDLPSPIKSEFSSLQPPGTSPVVEGCCTATLTVTKLQPSVTLKDGNAVHRRTESTENFLVTRHEKIEVVRGEIWKTETVILDQSNTDRQNEGYQSVNLTPCDLPTSPKSEEARRSTHPIRYPVVLKKDGLIPKNLFSADCSANTTKQDTSDFDCCTGVEKLSSTLPSKLEINVCERDADFASSTASLVNHESLILPEGAGEEKMWTKINCSRVQPAGVSGNNQTFSGSMKDRFFDPHNLVINNENCVSACEDGDAIHSVSTDRTEQHTIYIPEKIIRNVNILSDEESDTSSANQEISTDSLEPEAKSSMSKGNPRDNFTHKDFILDGKTHSVTHYSLNVSNESVNSANSASNAINAINTTSMVANDVDDTILHLTNSKEGCIESNPADVLLAKETTAKPILVHQVVREQLLKDEHSSLVEAVTSTTISTRDNSDSSRFLESEAVTYATIPKKQSIITVSPPVHTVRSRTVLTEQVDMAGQRQDVTSVAIPREKLIVQNVPRRTVPAEPKDGASSHCSPGLMGSRNIFGKQPARLERKRLSPEAVHGEPQRKRVELESHVLHKKTVKNAASSTTETKDKRAKGRKSFVGVAKSRLILLKKSQTVFPKHPLPFAAKNMYYDERWQDKQERGFVHWLNFVLTPPEEYNVVSTKARVDAGSIPLDHATTKSARLAPTKEVLSFRTYAACRRLNNLRRSSCRLYQSENIARVVCRIELEVEKRRLSVRTDRMLHADIGIKQRILDMLLSYNPLWLRIGLETVFGEVLPVASNNDVIGLSRFILTRVLGSPDISAQYAHPTVPYLYQEGYADAMAQHTLKKFLMLVYFLDRAKCLRLITYDPCLFCKDADIKSTRDLLVQFSRDYLSGEGDITKHLAYMGYVVSHVQTPLDEFDYAVANLCTDLRDGLRLGRIVMMLSGDWSSASKLRAPAISRLQKIHNMETVFKTLMDRGLQLTTVQGAKLNPRDIVDGHREKTLAFLWRLIFHFQTVVLVNETELIEEISLLERTLRVKLCMQRLSLNTHTVEGLARRDSGDPDVKMENPIMNLLLKWCRFVCLHYGVKVENFTVSFSDGRALCCLIHHYHPGLLPLNRIQFQTTQSFQEAAEEENGDMESDLCQDWNAGNVFGGEIDPALFEKLLSNERDNFKTLYEKVSELGGIPMMLKATDMSNTIPDEHVVITYLSYLCARLLDLRLETRAARIIQLAWRRYCLRCRLREREVKVTACITIQRAVRKYLAMSHSHRRTIATVRIQAAWRGFRDRRRAVLMKRPKISDLSDTMITKLQANLRSFLTRKQYLRVKMSAVIIQCWFRAQSRRKKFIKQHQAALLIQTWYRGHLASSMCRRDFLNKRQSAITMQRTFRARKKKMHKQRMEAACKVQKVWRGWICRREITKKKTAVIKLQAWWRMMQARLQFLKLKTMTIGVQSHFCSVILGTSPQKEFIKLQCAAVTLQKYSRGFLVRKCYKLQKESAIVIQKNFRQYICTSRYMALRFATVILQQAFRAYLMKRYVRKMYLSVRSACIVIQRWWRHQMQRRSLKREVMATKELVNFHGHIARQQFYILQQSKMQERAIIKIQTFVRCHLARKKYHKLCRSTLLLQTFVRASQAKKRFVQIQEGLLVLAEYAQVQINFESVLTELHERWSAAMCIQARWRGYRQRKVYQKMKIAITMLQARWRGYRQRKHHLMCIASATTIQKWYLGLKRRHSAVKIQRWWRMCQERCAFQAKVKAVVYLQSVLRRQMEQKKFHHLRQASIVIQQYYRAARLGRATRLEHRLKVGAAVVIQSYWKMHRVRFYYFQLRSKLIIAQSCCRRFLAIRKYKKQVHAIISLQRWYRACVVAYQIETEYQTYRKSVILLQAVVRGHLHHKKYLRTVKVHHSVVKIQSWWRMCQQRERFLAKVQAAKLVQTAVRRHIAEKKYYHLLQTVIRVQQRYRATHLARTIRLEYQLKIRAALIIQSFWKMYIVRDHYLQFRSSVIRSQAICRKYLAIRNYRKLQCAVICVQRIYRAVKKARRVCAEYQKYRQSIISIQAFVRGRQQRRQFLVVRKSCTTLQSVFRMLLAKRHYQGERLAVIRIQRRWREILIGRKLFGKYICIKQAAIKLQAFCRGYLVRKHVYQLNRSACVIQKAFRSHQNRQRFLHLQKAVLTLQAHTRAILLKRKCQVQYAKTRQACITIQAAYKGSIVRARYHQTKQSVVILQAAVKGYKQRRCYQAIQQAALVCQRQYRAKRLGQVFRVAFLMIREASVVIQKYVRGYMARNKYRNCKIAVLVIQTSTKGWLCRREFIKKKKAVLTLQHYIRAWKKHKIDRSTFFASQRAATLLQRAWHLHSCRVNERRIHAAIIIQKYFRCFAHQRRYQLQVKRTILQQSLIRTFLARKRFVAKKQAVIKIQKRWRETLLTRKCREEFIQKKNASITLQSSYRGHQARVQYTRTLHCILLLQAVAKGWLERKRFQKTKKTVISLQRRVRANAMACRERNMFLLKKISAISIQRAFQSWQLRHFQKKMSSVICIQTHLKALHAQRNFVRTKNAIIRIQSAVRQHQAQQALSCKKSALVLIQRQVRIFLFIRSLRETVAKRNRAAVTIQQAFHKYQKMKSQRHSFLEQVGVIAKRHLAVILIQRWYRRHRLLTMAKNRLQIIVELQRWARMYIMRKKIQQARQEKISQQQKRESAAKVIQIAFRKWNLKQEEKHRERLVTKLQALWRGRQLRRSLTSKRILIVRKRVEEANKAFTEDKKLANRTTSALDFLLRYKQLAYILDALMHLEVATQLSSVCCERMVEENAVGVIYRLILSCNRSLPHMELIKYSVAILLNLAKYEKTTEAVYREDNSVGTLIELLSIYREKGGAIFTKSCMLLAIFGSDPQRRIEMCADKKIIEKLQSIHALTLRKHRLQEARSRANHSSLNATLPSRLHTKGPSKVRPAWILRRDSMQEIEDPLSAVSYLLNTLHIGPKPSS